MPTFSAGRRTEVLQQPRDLGEPDDVGQISDVPLQDHVEVRVEPLLPPVDHPPRDRFSEPAAEIPIPDFHAGLWAPAAAGRTKRARRRARPRHRRLPLG